MNWRTLMRAEPKPSIQPQNLMRPTSENLIVSSKFSKSLSTKNFENIEDALSPSDVLSQPGQSQTVGVQMPDWLSAWRELAERTSRLSSADPCFKRVLQALEFCDVAFAQDDWNGFQKARNRVARALKE